MNNDSTIQYFKKGGKWYSEARCRFPPAIEGKYVKVDRKAIIAANGGKDMPGLSSRGEEFIVVITPDDACENRIAFPRMLDRIGFESKGEMPLAVERCFQSLQEKGLHYEANIIANYIRKRKTL